MTNTKVYKLYDNGKLIAQGSLLSIAEQTHFSRHYLYTFKDGKSARYRLEHYGDEHSVYAYYIDDDFIMTGSIPEISEATGLKEYYLKFIRSNSSVKRNASKKLIRIEGETVIVKRTHNAKFAPVLESINDMKKEPKKNKRISVAVDKPLETTNWNMNDYHKGLFNSMFKKWRA